MVTFFSTFVSWFRSVRFVHGVLVARKIENQEGINNIDEIIEATDGVMVARLGPSFGSTSFAWLCKPKRSIILNTGKGTPWLILELVVQVLLNPVVELMSVVFIALCSILQLFELLKRCLLFLRLFLVPKDCDLLSSASRNQVVTWAWRLTLKRLVWCSALAAKGLHGLQWIGFAFWKFVQGDLVILELNVVQSFSQKVCFDTSGRWSSTSAISKVTWLRATNGSSSKA